MSDQASRTITPAKKLKGFLHIIAGSMFSGKTEELMRRLRRAEYAKQNVITIKHLIDNRSHHQCILSHNGQERSAHPVNNTPQGIKSILDLAGPSVDVVGFDEVQFFSKELIPVIMTLIEQGKQIIVAGLDLDFRGEPFGIMPKLMALADKVTKLQAICHSCGNESHYSQRIINGKPAEYDDPIVLVGASESYESRCRSCFSINQKPNVLQSHL